CIVLAMPTDRDQVCRLHVQFPKKNIYLLLSGISESVFFIGKLIFCLGLSSIFIAVLLNTSFIFALKLDTQ
ncbi:MAG: hypothetical protein ACKPEN_11940, partial [Planktothrix sp.]|uniref:hypothetical protein n=1 Tax=Planktothrix sp. TaxID=3088171 RepID=UPI0038D4EAD9